MDSIGLTPGGTQSSGGVTGGYLTGTFLDSNKAFYLDIPGIVFAAVTTYTVVSTALYKHGAIGKGGSITYENWLILDMLMEDRLHIAVVPTWGNQTITYYCSYVAIAK